MSIEKVDRPHAYAKGKRATEPCEPTLPRTPLPLETSSIPSAYQEEFGLQSTNQRAFCSLQLRPIRRKSRTFQESADLLTGNIESRQKKEAWSLWSKQTLKGIIRCFSETVSNQWIVFHDDFTVSSTKVKAGGSPTCNRRNNGQAADTEAGHDCRDEVSSPLNLLPCRSLCRLGRDADLEMTLSPQARWELLLLITLLSMAMHIPRLLLWPGALLKALFAFPGREEGAMRSWTWRLSCGGTIGLERLRLSWLSTNRVAQTSISDWSSSMEFCKCTSCVSATYPNALVPRLDSTPLHKCKSRKRKGHSRGTCH